MRYARGRRGGVLTDVDLDLVGGALEKAVAVARDGRRAEPPAPAPSELQPLLGFRRLNQPARAAIARVLDRDEAFRSRVVDSFDEGEMGTADELFLTRPEGWRDELEAMTLRRTAQVGVRDEQHQVQAIQRELQRAEARLAETEESASRSVAEFAELKRELTESRRDRRSMMEDRDVAVAQAKKLERHADEVSRRADEAEAALAVREREMSDTRRRLDQLEAELSRRPPAPTGAVATVAVADLDPSLARLRRAATEVGEAVAATEALIPDAPRARRTLAGPSRPTPPRRHPTALPGGIRDDSVEAARHLLGVPDMTLLIDGYNVSMLRWPEVDLADQRDRLVSRLEELATRTGMEPVVVFDGASGHRPAQGRPRQQVRVRFTPADIEADDEILGLVEGHPADEPVTVVSNDRQVIDGAQARGANVIASTLFLKLF